MDAKAIKKSKIKPMEVRTMKAGDEWDKANKILVENYNSGVAEFIRDQLRQFVANEKPVNEK